MTVTPDEIFALAGELAGAEGECNWRASVSRAYYASYHRARVIASAFEAGVRGGVHEALIRHLCGGADEALMERKRAAMRIGYKLQSLRGLRVTSDYELESNVTRDDAHLALKTTAELAELIGSYLHR